MSTNLIVALQMAAASNGSPLDAAIELGRLGYSCFPVAQNKHPTCPHGFKDASTCEDDLEWLWWFYPGDLVGVATGTPSQIAVIDIDKKHLEAWEWFHANVERLPRTRTHVTRSGGLHLIYGHYDGLRCSTSGIAKGVDIKADRGCITWWPAAGWPILHNVPIAPWPEFLVPEPPKRREHYTPSEPSRDISAALYRSKGLVRAVVTAPDGERNSVLYWAGCRLHEMACAGELDRSATREVYDALFRAALDRGLERREATTTLRSASRKRAA
jgi:Bifunctional DNA primase/polymerase, N-terminal